jgi:hypothetical protein
MSGGLIAPRVGLILEGQAFSRSVDALQPTLELAAEHRIRHLTVQAEVRPYHVDLRPTAA